MLTASPRAARVDVALPLAALGLAVVVGLVAAATSVIVAAGAIFAVATAVVVLRRPEIGAALTLAFPVVFGWDKLTAYDIRALGGGLTVTDVLLLLTMGAWSLDVLRTDRQVRFPQATVLLALLGFLLVVALNVALVRSPGVPLRVALNEVRPFLALLLVFPLVDRVRPIPSVRMWFTGLVLLSIVPSLTTLYHYLVGDGEEATFSGGAIRIFGTFLYPAVALILTPCLIGFERDKRVRVALVVSAVCALAAIFFSFQRGAWLAVAAGYAVVLLLSPSRFRRRVVIGVAVAATLAFLLVSAVNALSPVGVASPLESGLERLESAFNDRDVSRLHREAELSHALGEFRDHPVFGVGFGTPTRFYSPMYNETTHLMGGTYSNVYVHNSYSQLLMKSGLLGTAAYLFLIVAVAVESLRARRRLGVRAEGLALASLAVIVALAVLAQSGPHLTSGDSVLLVVMLAWCVESLRSSRTGTA